MDLNSKEFKDFLRSLGVEMESSDAYTQQFVQGEPVITLLQQARYHEAFYRIDIVETSPQLLVLLPHNQTPLKFHFYLVQFSESHPLFDAIGRLASYQQGSEAFEQERGFAEWQLLHAVIEMMKALFWAGFETSQFPHEITVQKIL